MNTSTATTTSDPLFETDFMQEMIRQIRAQDTYGMYDGKTPEQLLGAFILTREARAAIPLVGDPDHATIARIQAFYNSIAILIEKECGKMAVPLVHVTSEGFGRVVITVGKLVALDRSLRDVHRFGFENFSKMKTEADKYLGVATGIVGLYPEIAGL